MITVIVAKDILVPAELTMALSPDVTNQVLVDVMTSARVLWIKEAGERLQSSARDYIDGIQEVSLDNEGASIALVGEVPNMIETGMPAFDMHDTLLGPTVPVVSGPGQKGKRVNKDGGFYRAIPFRHQTPGTAGKGGGAPMGSQYFRSLPSALSGPMQSDLGKAIHKAAKALGPYGGLGPGMHGPLQRSRLPPGVGGVQKLRPHHSTDIYAGMVRQEKTYKSATQNSYTTFRMISDSKPDKWLHPGIAAVNIADVVVKHIQELAPRAFLAAAWSES